MSIFLATIENQRFLKSILMSDFRMKSAHASESIAALAGFGSHAAFCATASDVQGPLATHADFALFQRRSTSFGYDADAQEYLSLIYSRLDWPHVPWKKIKKNDDAAHESWFYDCEDRGAPFIVIKEARKYCTLIWDHITLDCNYDRRVRELYGDNLGQRMYNLYCMICRGLEFKSLFDGSWAVGKITGLSEAGAKELGNEFFRLLNPGNLTTSRRGH